MKATLVFHTKVVITVTGQRSISVEMDLYKLPSAQGGYPDGYKFSWIAFDPNEPLERILFDIHPPKGPHLHIDGDPVGTPYVWLGLSEAEEFFVSQTEARFGEITG